MTDISEIIKNKILEFKPKTGFEEVGMVVESGDGIVRIKGLPSVMAQEMIALPGNTYGIAFNLERDEVVAVLLGAHTEVKEGDQAKLTGRVMQVPVGESLIGRVVDALGKPIDGRGEVKTTKALPIERKAPEVLDREPVKKPLQTGYKLIDSMIPIGRGQRELIIGDRSTGKSTIAIDTIINQKGKGVICIYVAIGQKESNLVQMVQKLKESGAMDYTIVVSASASDPVAMQYIAPFAGCSMAEEFMYQGKDTLVVYDDLTKHAQAYRMISLLLRRPPGREAYPGDVFYLHSRLLERAAKLSKEKGGGSMTALPIIETQLGDITSYIPTNVISITDGQIFLLSELFNAGFRPAVDAGISVSRVGGSAQVKGMRKNSGSLRLDLAQYREKKSFALFAGEVDKETLRQLQRGTIITEVLKQDKHSPVPVEDQIIIICAASNGYMDKLQVKRVKEYESKLIFSIHHQAPDLIEKIGEYAPETEAKLKELIAKFTESF
ncbi:MAG: F0F1 ATP synthase subunit alpha [Candidatus Margulisiibacteriota bacterium]